jgi:DNA-directed RNA polymerase specialized sigma subunit
MKDCIKEIILTKKPCCNKECRLNLEFEQDLNCTTIAVLKHGPMTLEEIGKRHGISTVRAKQLIDAALVKLKKTLPKQNTI